MSSKTSECWTSGPRRIQLSVTASRIGEIDTQDESFTARLWIDAWWLPSPNELKTQVNEWEVLPNFQLTNAAEVMVQEMIKEPALVQKSGATHWKATIELVGKFRQTLDLHQYPIDCHALRVCLEMGNINDMVYCAADQDVVMSIEKDLCSLTGWTWIGAAISFTSSAKALSKSGNSYAQAIVEFKLKRDWQPYISRVVGFTMAVMACSSAMFLLDPVSDFEGRMGFVFTLVFSMVAFQFIIKDWLPMTSYSTLLEKYITTCTALLFLDFFECGIVRIYLEDHLDEAGENADADHTEFDRKGLYVQSLLVLAIHIVLFLHCILKRKAMLLTLREATVLPPQTNFSIKKKRRKTHVAEDGLSATTYDFFTNVDEDEHEEGTLLKSYAKGAKEMIGLGSHKDILLDESEV